MPVKNASIYLPQTLDSILNQGYQNWELLAVDDGSTDDSFNILEDYSKREPRILVTRNTGEGIIHALRIAYAQARGEMITRMDADDRMVEDKIGQMVGDILKYGKRHIAIGLVKYFSDKKLGAGYNRYEQWLNELTRSGRNFEDVYKECVIPSPCWMLYKDDLHDIGHFERDSYPEDYDLCFRMFRAGFSVIPSERVLHLWRDYSDRSSRTDPNYSDNKFLNLKMAYFIEQFQEVDKQLILWGAGKKGKAIARLLIKENINFEWITENVKKQQINIYDKITSAIPQSFTPEKSIIIVSVSNPDEQHDIRCQLEENDLIKGYDYYMFF